MRVAAFDLSFRTGWAVLENSPHAKYGASVVGAGVISPSRTQAIRLEYIKSAILAVDYVGIEDVFITAGSGYTIEVAKRVGEVRALCFQLGKQWVEIHPSTMRAFVQKFQRHWLKCKKCKELAFEYHSGYKMVREYREYKSGHFICPKCNAAFDPVKVKEGKEPVIAFAQSIEPCLQCTEDDADAIVLALIAGNYFNVFPNERLEGWRMKRIESLRKKPKVPIKKVKRKKKKPAAV